MATSVDYVNFVCEQIQNLGTVRYRKMFGEYLVYLDDKPVLMVCDNTVFVKKLPEIEMKMKSAKYGFPYTGAKEHYILDLEDTKLTEEVLTILKKVVPIPAKKVK